MVSYGEKNQINSSLCTPADVQILRLQTLIEMSCIYLVVCFLFLPQRKFSGRKGSCNAIIKIADPVQAAVIPALTQQLVSIITSYFQFLRLFITNINKTWKLLHFRCHLFSLQLLKVIVCSPCSCLH